MIHNIYDNLISLKNILICWDEFKKGKLKKYDVMEFERYLEDNIFKLHFELANLTYKHNPYVKFHIYDPKHRIIHKATVKDRLVHHIVFKELYNIYSIRLFSFIPIRPGKTKEHIWLLRIFPLPCEKPARITPNRFMF